MIPKILDKFETEIGLLPNCISGIAIEERNGMCEIEVTYPIFSSNWESLKRGNIIVADVNDTLKNQKFRIYRVSKPINGKIAVYARHIFFDLARDIIEGFELEGASCEYALNELFRRSQFSNNFKGYSDIINAQNYKISTVNLVKAIGGTQGSILDTYGTRAEILRDNRNVHVLNRRGHDNGVTIEYAKNMTGLDIDYDDSDLITRIKPIAKYTDENNNEILVESNPRYVDSPKIGDYETPFVQEIDFSDKFRDNEKPTPAKLKTLAENYFRDNKCDEVKVNIKVEFIPLSKCLGYEHIQDQISLCDTVAIKDYRYKLDTQAKVIKTYYDFLAERYDKIELGEPRTSLGDIVGGGSGEGAQGPQGPQGPPGPQGPQGPPGADGNLGDFPNSLPVTPVLSYKVYGFANIELSWTFENKVYYSYELYASKTKGFTPNTFDLIHAGQSSSFLFQAKPNETWYFKVCAINSYGNRTAFSSEVSVTTKKIDDFEDYFSTLAVGNLVASMFTADYMEAGIIKGNWIDAKQLSVTDGNGKRTLDIDTFGNVRLDVASLSISAKAVATQSYADTKKTEAISAAANDATNKANNALNDAKTYTNAQITTVNDKVSSAQSEISILQGQISSKVSQSDVDRTVANIQVGGRNLVKNSDVLQNLLSTAGGYAGTRTVVNDSAAKSGKHIQFKCTTAGSGFHLPLFPKTADKIGKTYTWSFWAKGSVNKNGNVGHECGGHANIALTTEWKKFSHTWKYTDATYHSFTFYLNWNVNEIMYIRDFKIEEGNKATDWTPAPEDTDKLIADNIKVVTDKISNVSSELNQTKDSITASVSSLTTKTTTIETNLNNTTKDLTGKINTAKTEAINTASSDATTKANNALNDAKSYTNTQITEAKASIKITTDSISSEVSKKVNSNQIISSINQTAESVKIKANKIQLEGSTTIGDSENRHIKIDKANYSIYRGDRKLGYFGVVDDEKNGHPKLTLGHNGIRVENDDYLTLHAYGGGGNNAEGNSSAYCDFAYHSIKFKDWSNIKMYGNGDIKLAPIKDLIISTNYSDGSYGGEGENKVAMFAGSTSQYYKGNLQIGAVRNMTNSYGLVLTDDHAANKCAVRVNVDGDGNRFFRPLTTDGNIELGSGGYKWKKVHSVNGVSYSVRDNSLEPAAICMMDNSIDTALDTLNFSMNFQRGHNKRSTDEIQLELDISQLKEHELSNMFLNITEEECEDGEILTSTSADMTSLLHLALYELQKQKEEIKFLKEEIENIKNREVIE